MIDDTNPRRDTERIGRSARILLVDDEALDLRTQRLILEGQGFQVFACSSFEAGIQVVEKEHFDFVLVSQGTIVFEGRHLIARALELYRDRPVLVVTRCLDMPCYLEAMQLGAIDYMVKPIPPADLVRFVKAHVQVQQRRRTETLATHPARA